MNSLQLAFAILGVVLIVGTENALGIKCHICNSGDQYEGKECEELSSDKFLMDCNEFGEKNNFPEYINATMCRKMDQTVQDDYRVVRSCAQTGRTDRCIERTGTRNIKVTYCECDTEGCNTAAELTIPVFTVLITALVAVVMRS
jgi:hypothetical protein